MVTRNGAVGAGCRARRPDRGEDLSDREVKRIDAGQGTDYEAAGVGSEDIMKYVAEKKRRKSVR